MSVILFLGICTSCNTSSNGTYNRQMKESFIYDFRLTYYKKLMFRSVNDSGLFQKLFQSDGSGYGELILSLEDYRIIDSLVEIDNSKMVADSIKRIGRVAEGARGKHVLSYALQVYESKWLKTLAKKRSKIFMKSFR